MSPELNAFRQRIAELAIDQPHAYALWGDGLKLDYAELDAEIRLRQQILSDLDAKVVAIALDNGPDFLIWDLAILFEGLACLALPPFFSTAQRLHCLEQSQADVVIAGPDHDDELEQSGFRCRDGFWIRAVSELPLLAAGTAKLTFTSGTTGTPKGVCLSADSVLRVARGLHDASESQQPLHHLSLLPLAILLENIGCYAALYAGAMISLPSQRTLGIQGASGVDLPRLLSTLKLRNPHSMILVPQLLLLLITACEIGALDSSQLRFVAVGGAKVSHELLLRADLAGLPVYEGYGLSECASVVALNRPGAHHPGSVGKPLSHVQIRLAEDGEVMIAGSGMLGYLGDSRPVPEWWPTGDLGEFDANGYLYLHGRKKHQFVTSFGRNVNPEWVEAELTQHGRIGQAFVYGEAMAHNHALIWPQRPETTDLQLADAVAQANRSLPDYARVHGWTRLEQPFSPGNGMATANGRPKRDAILAHYRHLFIEPTRAKDFHS
ncbi:long-chain acyl-CoA synthetase [Pseudomonas sp. Bc-h]|uniref:AMP-binding protein n=1 Tax=Pseudomonas sp. Bc-h TaxID=1943632 RepID=UPI0009DAF107|nr:AMP-binding protein [Pseudomonas sp. Bc-h]OQR36512.1 long-chain acyl-CoA synthetase [Pseudomonas sp. Bc-h]